MSFFLVYFCCRPHPLSAAGSFLPPEVPLWELKTPSVSGGNATFRGWSVGRDLKRVAKQQQRKSLQKMCIKHGEVFVNSLTHLAMNGQIVLQ